MQSLKSHCPATGQLLWEGPEAGENEIAAAAGAARGAFAQWRKVPLDRRIETARAFAERLKENSAELFRAIAQETGKPGWEARQEVQSMIAKVEISITAQAERAGQRSQDMPFGNAQLRHRPHGVMAVLGPYNFPGHLPNGHIVPALLAGNTVIFKPSEQTPLTGEVMGRLWQEAGLPEGVLSVVQGGRDTGALLAAQDLDGVLFTGSVAAGTWLRRTFLERPGVILALELGGNNPIVAWDGDAQRMAAIIAQSAFITTGQRCSCARRLIVPEGPEGERIVEALVAAADKVTIGQWDDQPGPAIGPLVSSQAAEAARHAAARLADAGAKEIRPLAKLPDRSDAFLSPAIYDVTGKDVPDEEIFAPILQITRVPDFGSAIAAANATAYGLSASLLSDSEDRWEQFVGDIRAGVINRNRPTTGASGAMPFGGLGISGNHRPSAYYAADYCAYPVASLEAEDLAHWPLENDGFLPATQKDAQ